MQPLQPSPRASALIQSLITKMEDEARVHDEPPTTQQPAMHPPPSNREIEEVIKSAMALASRGGVSREGSRAGSPEGFRNQGETFQQQPQHHQQYQQQHLHQQNPYNGYLNPQMGMPMQNMGMNHAGMGMGPAPSMQSFHAYPKPVSLPLFSE
jgi:hypothetical protein